MSSRLDTVKEKVAIKATKRDLLIETVDSTASKIEEQSNILYRKQRAHELLELFVKGNELRIKEYIEPIINSGLLYVFEQELFFHLHFQNRRNQLEIDFIVLRNTEVEKQYQECLKSEKKLQAFISEHIDINDSFGGAVNQVLGLLLGLIVAELLKIKGPIMFDEPTSMVSEAYNSRLGLLLHSLSVKYHRQYIFITHSASLAECADKKYQVDLENGVSKTYVSTDN
jgi:DNA repair exonuclease SbcCD ATPase subunit